MGDRSSCTFETGKVLNDKWIILEFIGKGGMGEVYRAHQVNLDRDVAIKVISDDFVKSMEGDTEATKLALDRFRREVRAMAQVRHPNVLQIFDYGSIMVKKHDEEVGVEYIAMEYIPGGSLRATMSEEGFYPEEDRAREWLSSWFLPLLDGVQAIHEAGIIHRDLKPENVLLDGKTPKIADFGLARSNRLKPVTQSVDMRGTPPYMSPEHFLDLKRTDERTDVYALGKILFEALVGRMKPDQIPFRQAKLPDARTPFFQELDRIIREATAEERDERTPSAAALKQAVHKLLAGVGKGMFGNRIPTVDLPAADVSGGISFKKRLLTGAIALFLILALGAGLMFLYNKSGVSQHSGQGPDRIVAQGEIFEKEIPPPTMTGTSPAAVLQGKDASTLRLVPAGEVILDNPSSPSGTRTVRVESFYMDETKVTQYQFMEFLNHVLPRITVENGLVKGDGKIWLLLGEVEKGCDPVSFRNGKFHSNEPQHASCPSLRVTAYGALAYAQYYGRRLPTEAEWRLALRDDDKIQKKDYRSFPGGWDSNEQCAVTDPPQTSASGSPEKLPVCSPVALFKPNALGIRGLNVGGEWGVRGAKPASAEERGRQAEFVVLGGSQGEGQHDDPSPGAVKRFPWEGFEEVGFRTVLSARTENG